MLTQAKQNIILALKDAIRRLEYILVIDEITVEKTKDVKYGHITTNIAFLIGSRYKKDPNAVAQEILNALAKKIGLVDSCEIGSGCFINFTLNTSVFENFYGKLIEQKDNLFKGKNFNQQYIVEIVSANPNGSLHIGHVRNAVFSDVIANLLSFDGNKVCRVYLINNRGQQVKDIVYSVWVKYQHILFGTKHAELSNIPYNTIDAEMCAYEIIKKKGNFWKSSESLDNVNFYNTLKEFVVDYFLSLIKEDLAALNVAVDFWHYEQKIATDEAMQLTLSKIANYTYFKDNAVWFKTSHFYEKEKDDVIIKSDGEHTYFGQDLIYHQYKLALLNTEGKIVNVFACDHDSHAIRLKAFFKSLKIPEDKLIIKTLQLSRMISDDKKEVISKRNNNIVSAKDLFGFMSYEEIRWFFIFKDASTELDIDIDKLRDHQYNNQISYILYAYARIEQIFNKWHLTDLFDRSLQLNLLKEKIEQEILNSLIFFETTLATAIQELKPSILCVYVFKLAQDFHSFYEICDILKTENKDLMYQRLALCNGVKHIISIVLSILNIPTKSKI